MSGLGLGLGLGLGAHRKVGASADPSPPDPYGELPATFTVTKGEVWGRKRINFSEPVTVTMTGDVELSIGGTEYYSGDTIPVATSPSANPYHELTINNTGAAAGTITFGKRKQIRYLYLNTLDGGARITGDITGMKLTYLDIGILGSSVITGSITGMELTALRLWSMPPSVTYGTNSLNITNSLGIQLLGTAVFSAEGNRQLIIDAAAGTWSHATTRPFKIMAGTTATDPGWDTVSAAMTVLKSKTTARIISATWLQSNGGTWPANWDA